MPEYDGNHKIVYSLREEPVAHYDSRISGDPSQRRLNIVFFAPFSSNKIYFQVLLPALPVLILFYNIDIADIDQKASELVLPSYSKVNCNVELIPITLK